MQVVEMEELFMAVYKCHISQMNIYLFEPYVFFYTF